MTVDTYTECPLEENLGQLQDDGANVYVIGWNPEGTRALVMVGDRDTVTIASADACNGVGRFECSREHFHGNSGHYYRAFPVRDRSEIGKPNGNPMVDALALMAGYLSAEWAALTDRGILPYGVQSARWEW